MLRELKHFEHNKRSILGKKTLMQIKPKGNYILVMKHKTCDNWIWMLLLMKLHKSNNSRCFNFGNVERAIV